MYQVYFLTHGYDVIYVGCTGQSLKQRFSHFGKPSQNHPIDKYVRKHGKENIKINHLQSYETRKDAETLEGQTIEMWQPICNATYDGKPGSKKGEKSPMFGKTHTAETRRKMSESHKGDKNYNFGKTLTAEHRQKISKAMTGDKNPSFGKTRTAEARKKISEAGKHPVWFYFGRVKQMRSYGFYIHEIAEFFGCSRTPIHNILKSNLQDPADSKTIPGLDHTHFPRP